jgi:hypothetical protein
VIGNAASNAARRTNRPKSCARSSCKNRWTLIKHDRHLWLLLAESHLTRRLFGAMVGRIESLPLPAG